MNQVFSRSSAQKLCRLSKDDQSVKPDTSRIESESDLDPQNVVVNNLREPLTISISKLRPNSPSQEFRKVLEIQKLLRHHRTQPLSSRRYNFLYLVTYLKLKFISLRNNKNQRAENQKNEEKYMKCIADKASPWSGEKKIFHRNFQKICNLFNVVQVIDPLSPNKLLWDLLNTFVMIFYFIYVPILLCFDFRIHRSQIGVEPHLLFLSIFSVDLLLNFFTGFFERGVLVMEKSLIPKNYLTKNFSYDIICVLTLFFAIVDWDNSGMKGWQNFPLLLLFLNYRKFYSIYNIFQQRYPISKKNQIMLQLLNLLATTLFITHLFCALWLFLARVQHKTHQESWLLKYEEDALLLTPGQQYLRAFYYITVTMVTVGYGDITPKTDLEIFFCILTMFLCCGIFAYVINEIGMVVKTYYEDHQELKNQLHVINNYMVKKGIERNLQFRIREYLKYFSCSVNENDQKLENSIIQNLPQDIRDDLLFQANNQIINNLKVLRENFSDITLKKSCRLFQQFYHIPGTDIYQQGEENNLSLFYLEKGSIEIYIERFRGKPELIRILQAGSYFGQEEFFTGLPQRYRARARDFCSIIRLKRSEFTQLLQLQNEGELEKFCEIRDNLIFNERFDRVDQRCAHCENMGHVTENCSKVHLVVLPRELQLRERSVLWQLRKESHQRKKARSKNALKIYRTNKQQISEFQAYNSGIFETQSDGEADDAASALGQRSASNIEEVDSTINLVDSFAFKNSKSISSSPSQSKGLNATSGVLHQQQTQQASNGQYQISRSDKNQRQQVQQLQNPVLVNGLESIQEVERSDIFFEISPQSRGNIFPKQKLSILGEFKHRKSIEQPQELPDKQMKLSQLSKQVLQILSAIENENTKTNMTARVQGDTSLFGLEDVACDFTRYFPNSNLKKILAYYRLYQKSLSNYRKILKQTKFSKGVSSYSQLEHLQSLKHNLLPGSTLIRKRGETLMNRPGTQSPYNQNHEYSDPDQ